MIMNLHRTVWVVCFLVGSALAQVQPHAIDIVADKDSRYKIAGQSKPEITLKAGEQVTLRITANKGKTWNRDGTIHGFTLLRASNRTKRPGWNFASQQGTQELHLTASRERGDYVVVCTVLWSEDHEGMNMKLVVVP